MYYEGSYTFPCTIIEGNRITVPISVIKAKGWEVGTEILVKFDNVKTPIKGIVI